MSSILCMQMLCSLSYVLVTGVFIFEYLPLPLDIQGPTIDCPPNLTIVPNDWKNCTVINIRKDKPKAYDNSGSTPRHRIFGEPENDIFCVGHTHLTYEAYDMTGNTKRCEREIHVIGKKVNCFYIFKFFKEKQQVQIV